MKPRRRHRHALHLAAVLLAMGFLGLVLRWTVRDRWSILAPVFYGLPPLVATVVLVLAGSLFAWLRKKRWAVVALVFVAVGVVTWRQTDYVHGRTPDRVGEGFSVVFWNIARPDETDTSFVPALTRAGGQIVVASESGEDDQARHRFWASHFPDHHVSLLGGEITLLSKFPILNGTLHWMQGQTRAAVYDLDTPFGLISVVVADIDSSPFVPRKPCIDWVYGIATARPYPTIVLGDFNTPHTSAFFGDFRRTYKHAFEEAGRGLETTWPALLPVLALDYIWLSKEFVPLSATLRHTIHSDHALVAADVKMLERPAPSLEDEQSRDD